MIDKNKSEKKRLQDFAVDYARDGTYAFPDIDVSVDSYYIHRSECTEYIQEYGFETADEIRKELEKLWEKEPQMDRVIKVILVAALKNEPDLNNEENLEIASSKYKEEKLPEYIYNF